MDDKIIFGIDYAKVPSKWERMKARFFGRRAITQDQTSYCIGYHYQGKFYIVEMGVYPPRSKYDEPPHDIPIIPCIIAALLAFYVFAPAIKWIVFTACNYVTGDHVPLD